MANVGGQPGNQNAVRGRVWRDAIERALAKREKCRTDGIKEIDVVAEKLVEAAYKGDITALKELGDRLEGKPAQAITGADGGPIETRNVTEVVTRGIKPDSGLPGQGAGRTTAGDHA